MRLIDADSFERDLKEKLLPLLVEKYGKEEAMKGLHFSLQDCISNIQDQPTITQPEQRWIPCSERLPEEDACYLVTTSGTNNDIIDIAYYAEGIWHKASRIKAWMTLPEPYHEGEQDD